MIPGTSVTHVRRGDVSLAVTHAGDGPVVLLLHGFPELAYSWRHQFAPLAAAGYTVVVGAGQAEKHQIQAMIGFLLPKAKFEGADEADALAIAICHANHRGAQSLAAKALAKVGR